MFLEPEQVQKLTGKKMPSAQIRQLGFMGIAHLVNGLNQPIVSVSEVERVLSLKPNRSHSVNRAAIRKN